MSRCSAVDQVETPQVGLALAPSVLAAVPAPAAQGMTTLRCSAVDQVETPQAGWPDSVFVVGGAQGTTWR